jgi:exosortase
VTGLAFLILFWEPMITLVRDWWNDAESAHGLLLFPIALYLAWRAGLVAKPRPQPALGLLLLVAATLLRCLSGMAAELFTMRASLIGAVAALVVFAFGWRQLSRWWLSFALICLSVPIPAVLLNTLALPLQLKASALGASLLHTRHVPVLLEGNVLRLPDRTLFVTEACSGLRSLTALIALGLLIGGMWLRTTWSRVAVLLVAIPVAMLVNSLRVFVTGFLVYYVDPALATGFTHYTEGWVLFIVAFALLGSLTWVLSRAEQGLAPA